MRLLPVISGALLAVAALPCDAESLVATRVLRAGTILAEADVALAADSAGGLTDPRQALGLETRVTLYKGQPVRPGDIGPVTLIDRNEVVTLRYRSGPLTILVEGRALGRGGVGDRIRVMNGTSRATVTGEIAADGTVQVPAAN